MPRPVLRLATRLTRRTRTTAWAIAFACMVLVGTLGLADGFANGVGSVADRIGSGPSVYIRGQELLASEIDADRLSEIPGDFLALRAHTGELEINNESLPVVVVALVNYQAGNATDPFPVGARDLSLDEGLRERIQEMSERPVENAANLSLFGIRLTGLPVVPPPPTRSPLFPDTWAYVRTDLLAGMDLVHGGSVQAIVTNATLDASIASRLGLTRMDPVGAVGFVRAGVAHIQATSQLLALVIGLVTAPLVYAASSLGALPGEPVGIVAGDAYAITQGTGPLSINVSLASNITASGWAKTVSPEILGLTTLAGNPVVVRAVDPDAFLRLENATHLSGAMAGSEFALAGEHLALRFGLATGDTVTVAGAYVPRIAFLRITGTFRTESAANDELLVDFGMGRFLTGLGPLNYHSIRVRTPNPAALLRFLDGFQASVHVSGPGLVRADIHSDPPSDERLANAILRTGLGGAPRDYLATAVGEATTSVRVVAYGIAVLLGILVAFGVHAVQARAFADRIPAVGVLRAVGASNGWMRRRLLVETLPFSLLAGVVGALVGFFAGKFLQPQVNVVVFGHQVPIVFDVVTLVFIVLLLVGVSIGSALVLLRGTLRLRPAESIRATVAVDPPRSLGAILRG